MGETDFSGRLIREKIKWKGCEAIRQTNGIVELISLASGGHLASFRFVGRDGQPSPNVLWEAPWTIGDPDRAWSVDMSLQYGPPATGKFLSGFTGHALCIDYFGDPTPEKAAAGLGLHGEAATSRWRVLDAPEQRDGQCRWVVHLPISRLTFERKIHLLEGQSVAYVEETVCNERDTVHRCDWVQHVTFGQPFLSEGDCTLIASAQSGMTSPLGYEGRSLLPNNRHFAWPFVRDEANESAIDLRLPFTIKGRGFLAGMELEPAREIEFLLAVNWQLRLGVGYCFRRRDFPWMAVWEENCARQDAPWNGNTQARGMEFGTTPLPLAAEDALPGKQFSSTPRGCCVSARGKRNARYMMFLFTVPTEMHSIDNVVPAGDALCIFDTSEMASFSVPADGCEAFLA